MQIKFQLNELTSKQKRMLKFIKEKTGLKPRNKTALCAIQFISDYLPIALRHCDTYASEYNVQNVSYHGDYANYDESELPWYDHLPIWL